MKFLLIYLNDLCCFRVLCYVLVLQCGNSPENCCVFSSGVLQENPKKWHEVLFEALWAHRISHHDAAKVTPFEIMVKRPFYLLR